MLHVTINIDKVKLMTFKDSESVFITSKHTHMPFFFFFCHWSGLNFEFILSRPQTYDNLMFTLTLQLPFTLLG